MLSKSFRMTSRVNHKPMLVHHRLQRINDTGLFLLAVLDLFDMTRVYLGQHRFQQFREHTITKVRFDHHTVDLMGGCFSPECVERLFGIASRKSPPETLKRYSMQNLNNGIGRFVVASPGRVDGHD